MSHINLHSVIDVECVNSVSNRSKDIISLNIKVCRWFLLNNKILTFHYLFTFTESIDKQQNRLISNSHGSTYYNKLLYVCGGERYCEWLVNLADLLFVAYAILLFQVHP